MNQGIKLRELRSLDVKSHNCELVFDLPQPAVDTFRFLAFDLDDNGKFQPRRLSSLFINTPEIIGYSASWFQGPRSLHAHTSVDDMSFYQCGDNTDPCFKYLYIPMDKGELVTQFWWRNHNNGGLDEYIAFVFKTNKGRVGLMGHSSQLLRQPYTWRLSEVFRPEDGPGRIFFHQKSAQMESLGFLSPDPILENAELFLPVPLSPHPRAASHEPYHYTAAPLDGICEITPCRGINHGRQMVIGILLQYESGHIDCVGQIRRDWLGDPVVIDPSQNMVLGFTRVQSGPWERCSYLFDVRFSRSEPSISEVTWFEVPWHGTLEWWFSYRQAMVYHEGRASPPTVY